MLFNTGSSAALKFQCVGGCWDRAQDCCDFCIDSQTLTTRLDLIHIYSAIAWVGFRKYSAIGPVGVWEIFCKTVPKDHGYRKYSAIWWGWFGKVNVVWRAGLGKYSAVRVLVFESILHWTCWFLEVFCFWTGMFWERFFIQTGLGLVRILQPGSFSWEIFCRRNICLGSILYCSWWVWLGKDFSVGWVWFGQDSEKYLAIEIV